MTFDIDKTLIVIPLFNHAATVREVAQRALALHDRVLVVDDGSSDGGADTLQGLGVQVLREETNKGKGAAIMIAAREAARMGMTHLVTIDADGQHDPADMQQIFKILREEPFSIVVGKRDFDTSNVPGSSRFGRKFSNFWLRLQTGRSLQDTQSGFRAYPLAVLEGLKLKETRYSFEIEVLVKAAWAGVSLRDADISVYYPPAEKRVSHFDKVKDNLRLTLLNTHLTMRSILPWPHRKIVHEEKSPKVSLFRPMESIRCLLTENTSPGRLAAAGALGVILGAAPLIACHTIAVLFAAGFFRLNKVAAVSTSQLCMPPLVPALCIEAGYFMRHGEFLTEVSWQTLGHQGFERLYEWLIGSLLIGPLLGALVGGGIYATAMLVKKEKVVSDG
ncbi:MAG: glycosyl transferase family 2 [Desulfuromonadales bacterium C00003094]|jgi:glycosyltransferase involved in cell wall biosynthesis|nr:MAG: glycosyl transferase family 2 [Desulfuromonadales bacterium C00003094]OEU73570.1 MAG: glycosyl transferase family 2 [Desulfuromonadales bacterium C00003107]